MILLEYLQLNIFIPSFQLVGIYEVLKDEEKRKRLVHVNEHLFIVHSIQITRTDPVITCVLIIISIFPPVCMNVTGIT